MPPKQITIRGPSPELVERLRALSEARGESLNATILHLLEEALGVEARRQRLRRAATWTDEDAAELEEALRAQRVIDDDLWQ